MSDRGRHTYAFIIRMTVSEVKRTALAPPPPVVSFRPSHARPTAGSRASTSRAARACSQSTVSLVLSGKAAGRVSAETEKAVRARGRRPRLPPERGRPRAAHRRGAQRRAHRPRRDEPVLRPRHARRPAAAWTAGLRRRARRHGQRPRVGARLLRGAARRAGRRLPRLRHRPAEAPPRHARRADRAHGGRGARPSRRSASTAPAAPTRSWRTCSASATAASAASPRRSSAAPSATARTRWRAALAAAGIDADAMPHAAARSTSTRPGRPPSRSSRSPDPPTAIFCDDDILAGGVYLAARELRLRIPRDVSVVGFDDLDFTAAARRRRSRPSPPTRRCSARRPSRRSPRTCAGEKVPRVRMLPVS